MRIIFESDEQTSITPPRYEPKPPAPIETMDGGAPSETLIQSIPEELPTPAEREGLDGGSPPEWLVVAIQGVAQPRTEPSGMDTDAGSAPSSEG